MTHAGTPAEAHSPEPGLTSGRFFPKGRVTPDGKPVFPTAARSRPTETGAGRRAALARACKALSERVRKPVPPGPTTGKQVRLAFWAGLPGGPRSALSSGSRGEGGGRAERPAGVPASLLLGLPFR